MLNITPDYKYYILICGIFNSKRNIIKHWATYEPAFLNLVKTDGEKGPKRLLQSIIIFFINKYPDQKKYASGFCKLLYDSSTISDEFFTAWHSGEVKLDKNAVGILYDRKAEKQFKTQITDFIEWLQYGEEDAAGEDNAEYGEEEEAKTP